MEPLKILENVVIPYLVLLFSLSVHESAHAWTALRMGDETGLRKGRISLNPLVHMDPIGTVIFPLIGLVAGGVIFGWAKPVPVQPRYFRQYRMGQILTAGAGPGSNFLLAVIFAMGYAVLFRGAGWNTAHPLVLVCYWGIVLNVILGAFNLIPVPPLDGSWIASMSLPRPMAAFYDKMIAPYGFMILMLLLISGALSYVLDWVAWPIARGLLSMGAG